MSAYRVVEDYPHPVTRVWRAVTEPALVAQWTTTGRGGRPEGFSTEVGTRFRYIGKPTPGWNGIVDCEVLEVREPTLLRYTWKGGENDDLTVVTCRLEPHGDGTRLTWEHTGFTGISGFLVSRILASVRRKMLRVGLPPVLDQLGDGRAR